MVCCNPCLIHYESNGSSISLHSFIPSPPQPSSPTLFQCPFISKYPLPFPVTPYLPTHATSRAPVCPSTTPFPLHFPRPSPLILPPQIPFPLSVSIFLPSSSFLHKSSFTLNGPNDRKIRTPGQSLRSCLFQRVENLVKGICYEED